MMDKLTDPERFKVNEYSLQGEFNDTFLLKKQLVITFPYPCYNYDVYEVKDKNKILSLDKIEETVTIKGLYNSENLKCYMISDYILFKQANDSFKAVRIHDLGDNKESYSFLIPCLREMLTNSWDCMDVVSDFLKEY